MYADDMLVMAQNSDIDVMQKELQCKMNSDMDWCRDNKFTINKDKTKCMLVSSKVPITMPILYTELTVKMIGSIIYIIMYIYILVSIIIKKKIGNI